MRARAASLHTKLQRDKQRHAQATSDRFVIWQQAALIGAIVIAVAVVYLPAIRGDFVWDDFLLITGNPLLRNWSGLVEIWSGGRTADYFPLTNTMFWIEHHLFGDNATGYHAVNIILQIANALLVWRLFRQLSIPGAWLAGLIFGIHPVHAASVAWISELKNLLSMFFALLSILCFLELNEKPLRSATGAYVASLLFFTLALLSKTQVVLLPVVLVLCVWWRGKVSPGQKNTHNFQRNMTRALPFFLIAAVFGMVTIWFQNRGIGEEQIIIGSLPRRLVNAAMAVWWYAGHLLVPVRLMAIYPNWRFDSPRVMEWLPLFALVAVLTGLWHWRNRGTHGVFFAVACFVVALLPALGLLRMAYVRSGTLVADHHQYFADVALIGLVSAGAACAWRQQPRAAKVATAAIVTLLLGAMSVYAFNRAAVYRNEETLWQDNLAKNPDAWQAHIQMAQRRFKQERYAEAAYHARRAAELKPELADIHNELGLAYCRLERFEEGIAEYRKALQLKEANPVTARSAGVAKIRTNLANALAITAERLNGSGPISSEEARRRYEEAIHQYEAALEIDPEQPAIHRNLGMLLVRLRRYDQAIPHLRATLRIVPNEPIARKLLDAIGASRR